LVGYLLLVFWPNSLPKKRYVQHIFQGKGNMPQGKVKRLVPDRGFGFIEAGRGDLFFHHSEVKGIAFDELREGQLVDYQVGEGRKGPCATSVKLPGDQAQS
jgi:CspA family cold shock protein